MSERPGPQALHGGRPATLVALGGLACVLVGVVGTRVATSVTWIRIWDNVHWTLGYAAGAALAFIGWRTARTAERPIRAWLALALGLYTLGQIAWDIQVATDRNPFPGPSDGFYIWIGIAPLIGFGIALHQQVPRRERVAAGLHAAAIGAAALTTTLALYLPRRGTLGWFTTVVLVAYPVSQLWTVGVAVLLVLWWRLRLTRGNLLVLGALVLNGLWWMEWNSRTLDGTLADGVWFNYTFSFTALALGRGAQQWSTERSDDPRYDRLAAAALRILPLALVVMAALALAFAGHMAPAVREVAQVGGVAVTILAAVSQLLTLRERDALVEAERARVEAERALKLSQIRLNDVVHASSDAIFTLRVEGDGFRFEDANSAALAVFDLRREQLIGHTPAEALPPDMAPSIEANYRKCVDAGSPMLYDREVVKPQGSMWLSTALVPFRDDDGRVTSLTGIARNITAERRLVETMRQLNVDLERRVAERTAELEVSNRELEAFAYSVSHDLRAPLRAIDGYSQILVEQSADWADPDAIALLGKVRKQTHRMGQLIDDLLSLSRVTRAPLRRETFDLSVVANEVIADLVAADPNRNVRFDVASSIQVSADRNLIRVALVNLLSNAWKFTRDKPQACIAFEVSTSPERRFAVRDDGAGFDQAYADKLFLAFQRLHRTDEFEGTGVGLATVHRIISRHGGRIWGEGQVGKGATFWFTLPD